MRRSALSHGSDVSAAGLRDYHVKQRRFHAIDKQLHCLMNTKLQLQTTLSLTTHNALDRYFYGWHKATKLGQGIRIRYVMQWTLYHNYERKAILGNTLTRESAIAQ